MRKVTRDVHEHIRDYVRALVKTDGFEQSRRERKKVEMRFAHIKRILKLDRFHCELKWCEGQDPAHGNGAELEATCQTHLALTAAAYPAQRVLSGASAAERHSRLSPTPVAAQTEFCNFWEILLKKSLAAA